jgi:hypothetical protein
MTYRPYGLTQAKTSIKITKEIDSGIEPNDLIYIDLLHEAISDTITVSVDRVHLVENEDYALSLAGSVTRVTWINNIAPLGIEAMANGDIVEISYEY